MRTEALSVRQLAALLTGGLLLLVHCSEALKCVSCQSNSREECKNGTQAAANLQLVADCVATQSYCKVTVVKQNVEPNAIAVVYDTERGCAESENLSCSNVSSSVMSCEATCEGDLCNQLDDVQQRVALHKRRADGSRAATGTALSAGAAVLWTATAAWLAAGAAGTRT